MTTNYLLTETNYSYGLSTLPVRMGTGVDAACSFPPSAQNMNGAALETAERYEALEEAVKRFHALADAKEPAEIIKVEVGTFVAKIHVIEVLKAEAIDEEFESLLPTGYRYVSPIKGEDLLNLDTHVDLAADDALSSKMKALELRLGDLYREMKELLRSECSFLASCPSRYERSDRQRQALGNAEYLEEVTNSLKYAAMRKAEDFCGRYWW